MLQFVKDNLLMRMILSEKPLGHSSICYFCRARTCYTLIGCSLKNNTLLDMVKNDALAKNDTLAKNNDLAKNDALSKKSCCISCWDEMKRYYSDYYVTLNSLRLILNDNLCYDISLEILNYYIFIVKKQNEKSIIRDL